MIPLAALSLSAALLGQHTADAWEGARLRRIDRSERSEVQHNIQVPILSYHPVAPAVDSQGRIWLFDLHGIVRQVTPYLGETARWQVPSGLETPGIETPDGQLLLVSRDGNLLRLNPSASGDITSIAGGLPTATGPACRALDVNFWPDARGGVSLVSDQGELLARYEEEIYKRKRIRGGAAVSCHNGEAFIAVAGGKIAGLTGTTLNWAESPGILAATTFAPKAARTANGWLACNRESLCFLARVESGVLAATTGFGSIDGVHLNNNGMVMIAGTDGNAHLLDQQLALQQSVFVANDALWLTANAPAANQATTETIAWATTSAGHLYRVDFAKGKSERVYSAPSGFSNGGTLLFDGTALIPSNFGSTHVFLLR